MFELGKKEECFGTKLLKPLKGQFGQPFYGRPTTFPTLGKNESVICGYDQGLGERLIVCENLADMQQLYDSYAQGWALRINWYTGEDVGGVDIFIIEEQKDVK